MDAAKRRQERVRAVISICLSFLLSLFLTLFVLATYIKATVLNPAFMKRQAIQSGYMQMTKEEIIQDFTSYGISSGFENEAFFRSILNNEDMEYDLFLKIDRFYDPDAPDFNRDIFQEELYEKFEEEARKNGVTITEEEESGLRYLTEMCANRYSDLLDIPLQSYAAGILQRLQTPFLILVIVLLLFTAGAGVFLFRINPHKSQFARYAVYAVCGSAITIAVPILAIYFSGILTRIGISHEGLYTWIKSYLNSLVGLAMVCVGVLAAAAAALGIWYVHRRRLRAAAIESSRRRAHEE